MYPFDHHIPLNYNITHNNNSNYMNIDYKDTLFIHSINIYEYFFYSSSLKYISTEFYIEYTLNTIRRCM